MTQESSTPSWKLWQKGHFLGSYFWTKITVPFDVQNDRLRLLAFEWADFWQNLRNQFRVTPEFTLRWKGASQLSTCFGVYNLRPGTQDITVVSPAFERLDIDFLMRQLTDERAAGRRILFLDGGANIGRYTVAVLNRFSGPHLSVYAFEPDLENVALLRRNTEANNAGGARVEVCAYGLSDCTNKRWLIKNHLRPWDQGLAESSDGGAKAIQLRRLDDQVAAPTKGETVIFKLDIDGHEISALEGARRLLEQSERVILMIEDVIERKALYKFLSSFGAQPICKRTPYNSFWRIDRS